MANYTQTPTAELRAALAVADRARAHSTFEERAALSAELDQRGDYDAALNAPVNAHLRAETIRGGVRTRRAAGLPLPEYD